MAQKSHSQVSHNRRFATAVFGERQTVRQKVLLPLWVWSCQNTSTGAMAVRASAIVMLSEVWGWKRI
jgi:hypothetical protein